MQNDCKNEKFDIIIQAGQSNSEGCGFGDTDVPYVPDDRILHMEKDFGIIVAKERVQEVNVYGHFCLSFAREYVRNGDLQPGRKVLILRTAVGGTGFSDKRWGLGEDLYEKMMAMIKAALALNPENKLVALLWHQGETDAGWKATGEYYYDKLKTLVASVRDTFGNKALPFVAGDFVQEWKAKNLAQCDIVIGAMRKVCADIGSAGFVETDGLLSNNQKNGNGDDIHFCRDALYQMGARYYAAYRGIGK